MSTSLADLPTPSVVIDLDKLEANLTRMQRVCDHHGVALWPHIKTHKMVEVARRQLAVGAAGLTCAKLGEAEAMLPSGVRRIFIAHSLVAPALAPRLRALAEQLDELIVAATSLPQAEALGRLLDAADLTLPVMMAVDTGLGREGVRDADAARQLGAFVAEHPRLTLKGIYTHEGHTYTASPAETDDHIAFVRQRLQQIRDLFPEPLEIWPGCSVTAARMATQPGITAVRPGAYVFGDLYLGSLTQAMDLNDVAASVLTTVIDLPQPDLALLDVGSKTLSGDKQPDGTMAIATTPDGQTLTVTRANEEHGYLTGPAANALSIGDRLRLTPAHICPVINLTDSVFVVRGDTVIAEWPVSARGAVR